MAQAGQDIYSQLSEDHEKIKQLFSQLEQAEPKKRQNVFQKVKKELKSHAKAEENVFYAALRQQEPTHEPVLEGYEEHHVAELLLAEMSLNKPETDKWHAKSSVLSEIVEHHIEEEEGEIFKKARQVLNDQDAKDMLKGFKSEKRRIAQTIH